MRTGDTIYTVARWDCWHESDGTFKKGVQVAGIHPVREYAELHAHTLNKSRRIDEPRWQVQESTYHVNYEEYALLVDMKKADLVDTAKFWNVATSGTKHDIAERIVNIDIYN